jgi:thiosulfate reductase cytochrome b subunit
MASKGSTGRRRIFRHPAFVRVTHWINVICLAGLLMSGLQIFNAHPALYWGNDSHFDSPFVEITSTQAAGGAPIGVTRILGAEFQTTGVLGLTTAADGEVVDQAFPPWVTLPGFYDLATARRWHFFFAWIFVLNGLAYLLIALFGGHVRRDLLPTGDQLRHIGRSVIDHLRLRFPKGEEARRYNVLQKLSYLAVIFVLLPLIVLTGWSMSPGLNALSPIPEMFGGRQSARTIHFLAAFAILLFVVVHVVMVLLSGVWNNLRSMITGRYDIDEESHERKSAA